MAALLEKPVDIPALLSTLSRLMAEPVEARLARLAGQEGAFDYRPSQQHVG